MKNETQAIKQVPRWGRILISIAVGCFVAFVDYKSRSHAPTPAIFFEWLSKGILAAIVSALLSETWSLKASVDEVVQGFKVLSHELEAVREGVASELASLREHALGDERIIFARQQLSRDSRTIAVLGIEPVDPVPRALHYAPQGGQRKWKSSVSILRFDRIQDLLFSPDYLEHFFSLREKAESTNRILIVNDHPRSKDAIRSFLQISKNVKVQTFLYRKSEFYAMLGFLEQLLSSDQAQAVREIMSGNPELNLMVTKEVDFREESTGPINPSSDYLLRYLNCVGGRREVVTRAPGDRGSEVGTLPRSQVKWVFRLMTQALREGRLGLHAFEALISENGAAPENYWSLPSLQAMKRELEKA